MNNPFNRKPPKFGRTESSESQALHNRDDLDSSHGAHHHTLGPGPTQAAPGNHTHESAGGGWITGDVKQSYAPADNVEWFELNGQASPTPALTAMFGANLPDMRDKFIIGKSGSKALNATGGADTITIAAANLPTHTHTLAAHTHTIAHTHNILRGTAAGSGANRVVASNTTAAADGVGQGSNTASSGGPNVADTGNGAFANTPIDAKPPWRAMYMLVHA